MNFKEKVAAFKAVIENFDKLEKSVQVKLMAVADRLAPGVQGGAIAPKEMEVPEPVEYPDIKESVVPMSVKKHTLDIFSDQFAKEDWHPNIFKTQKAPSTTIPYEEKPGNPEYMKNPENVSAQSQSLRDKDKSLAPAIPAELHASGAMTKKEKMKKENSLGNQINTAQGLNTGTPPPAPSPATAASISGAFKSDYRSFGKLFQKSNWLPGQIAKKKL